MISTRVLPFPTVNFYDTTGKILMYILSSLLYVVVFLCCGGVNKLTLNHSL